MKYLLVKVLFTAILLLTLVQAAADYSKLTPEEKKKLFGAVTGGLGKKNSVVRCTKTSCSAGLICTGGSWGCAIPEGKKCTPVKDKCEGKYFCSGSGLCNGSGKAKLGAACQSVVECDKGLYCDLKENKCLEIKGGAICTKNSDCQYRCSSGDCICAGGSCMNR
ncbi:hypothetical protein K501DRAFT_275785 [Backusella circina FSU 941]|nr:hypothetical protein K501DRAFT_275785 [Backusella circina FSU 941]